ncbi:Vps53p [Nakaseomyces bracarensis]|uniref:Vps53p n=1 Tax=Nakaseomyces bracarensis TaxID=273131 RepID=UPI0038714C85
MIDNSLEYDPTEDITNILLTRDSLDEIDNLILSTRKFKLQLSGEIESKAEEEETESKENLEEDDKVKVKELMDKLMSEYTITRETSVHTQENIRKLTQGISKLDNAKQNLTQTMSFFQNLKIMTDCYIQCKTLLESGSFQEMVSPYRIMYSLAETTFTTYKSVSEINKLLTAIARLKADVFEKIKAKYTGLLRNGTLGANEGDGEDKPNELRDGACELLDSDQSSKSSLIDWFIGKLLYEMREIFQIDDEASSLENLSRRYIYFKKVLNNFHSNLEKYFLPTWDLPIHIASTFIDMTKRDLDMLLKREFHDKSPSIDLFMMSLQETLEFEKYINVRFSKMLNCKSKLSTSFEPYLNVWVSHQDKLMDKKMLGYMSEGKFPENTTDSFIVPSSADIFRNYRTVLSQTLELIQDNKDNKILIELAAFFTKWLGLYANKILEPLILPDNIEIEDKEECAKYTVLVVNTAGYCSSTIEQLEEKLMEFAPDTEQISGVFIQTKSKYDDLAARGMNFLLNRIIAVELSFVWREFKNVDWGHVMIEDYSRYMQTLKNLLRINRNQPEGKDQLMLDFILKNFNRDIYQWNFLDKVINLVLSEYLSSILKMLQPVPPYASPNTPPKLTPSLVVNIGEQLSLDIDLLKTVLIQLPETVAGDSDSGSNSTSMKRTKKRIESDIDKLLKFTKLLVAPVDVPETYAETYEQLTGGNDDSTIWSFTLSLKALPWDINQWKQLWAEYKKALEVRKQEEKNIDHSLLIMDWCPKPMMQFQTNICRIQVKEWSEFVRNDLRIHPPARTIQRATKPVTQKPRPQPQENKMAGLRDLVSSSGIFDR